jgi:ketosteroid isomerase-like protein
VVSAAELDLVKSIWPREADMVEMLDALPELERRLDGVIEPDTEIRFYPDELGQLGTQRGLEGFATAWREWLEPWQAYRLEVEDYVDAGGGNIVALARVRAVTRRDGVEVRHDPAAVCAVRDGRIVRIGFYLDRADALAAAGNT